MGTLHQIQPAAMSGDTQEAERIAADLANDHDKAAKAHRAQEASAMRLQLQHQSGDYL